MGQDCERGTGVGGELVGDEEVVVGQTGISVNHVRRRIATTSEAISYETAQKEGSSRVEGG
jgi:hypothetical protein